MSHFSTLFVTSTHGGSLSSRERVNWVSAIDNEELIAELTDIEVKEDVFSMHSGKSLGPDGLNVAFFQTYWGIVGGDVIKVCQNFMRIGELPSEINRTLVCLIPKVKLPTSMTELHPISLCNVLNRIVSKVMSNRLKPCLGKLISDKHSC